MTNTKNTEPSFAQLKEKGAQITEHVGEMAGLVSDMATRKIADFKEGVSTLQQAGMEKASRLKDDIAECVQAHPVKCILFAAGVGALVGAFLTRRR